MPNDLGSVRLICGPALPRRVSFLGFLLSRRGFGERKKMRPVFCGNFDHDIRHSDLERLFSKYGRVDRLDMKSGYAFVYFDDERDAEDAIRCLDSVPFGYSRRKLSVEWSKRERGGPRNRYGPMGANTRPTRTLFVLNLDPVRTSTQDIERHFERYGKIVHVRIRRNFAFVQFETQEDATEALKCTNMRKLLDRVISVEYAFKDEGVRSVSPGRGGYGRRGDSPYGRSSSPMHRRNRPSPDYGRARNPVYDRFDGPMYDRNHKLDNGRHRSRSPMRR